MLASQVAEGEDPPPEAKVMVCFTKRLQMGVTPNQHTKWIRNDSKEWATNMT